MRERDRQHAAAVGVPALGLRAAIHVPELDRAIFGRRGQELGIVAIGQRRDRALVAGEGVVFAHGRPFPDKETAGAIAGGQPLAIRRIGDGGDPVGVLLDVVEFFAIRGGEDAQHLLRPAQGDHFLIGRDVGGEHDVEFIADFGDALAGLYIPHGDFAQLGSLAAPAEQELAVAREGEHFGQTFGEGKHAEQVERLRVVEKNLLLSANRRDGGPWRSRQCIERAGTPGANQRLGREPFGHGRRASGLPDCGNHAQINLLDGHGLAARALQRAARNPQLDQIQILLRQPIGLLRHLRLVDVHHAAIEHAAIRIAGHDHLLRIGAGHRAGIAGDIQPAFFLVGVVTIKAGIAKNGKDVVLVSNLRCGRGIGGQSAGRGAHQNKNSDASESNHWSVIENKFL